MSVVGSQGNAIPRHREHQELISACNAADAQLHRISGKFDFLLCVSPTNTTDAMRSFLHSRAAYAPTFEFRRLDFDPEELRSDLHRIELSHLHEPLVEGLLLEKRRELDLQLSMLATRGTSAFREQSEHFYGSVSDELLATATEILGLAKPHKGEHEILHAEEIRGRALQLVQHYQGIDPTFSPEIEIRNDISGLLVSYPKLLIDSTSRVSVNRVDSLLSHEVSVHLLTGHNGAAQGLSIFSSGLAGYEEIQEGLGVFAEWAVGGLTHPRLRLIAGRVIAVRAMCDGADFLECYELLHREFNIRPKRAFQICARVYRSGGLAKDAIYLRGFLRVMEWIADGGDLAPYWRAKIAPVHVPALELLLESGLMHEARLVPEFLSRDDTIRRIDRYRSDSSARALVDTE